MILNFVTGKITTPPLRRLAGVLLVMALPVTCAAGNAAPDDGDAMAPIVPGPTLSGNYLAARHAQAMSNMTAAVEFLLESLEKDPDNPNLLRRTFVVLVVDGRIEESLPFAKRVAGLRKDSPIAGLVRIIGDIKKGRYAKAGERISGLPKAGLNSFMGPLLQAWTLGGLEKWDEALASLEPLTAKKGLKVLASLHGALINELAGRPEAAEKIYIELEKAEGGLSLRLSGLMGGFYERRGNGEKAGEIYQRYLKDNPASLLLVPAVNRVKEGGAPPPMSVENAQDGVAEGLFDLASSLRQQNVRETALIFGQLSLYLKPDFPENQILVANMLERSDRRERANDIYRAVNRASPLSWSVRLRVAGNLDRLGRTRDAIDYLKSMADEDRQSPDALIDLGDILRGKERYKEAVKVYDQAFARIPTLKPHHWSLLYARGIALERSKQWQRGEKDFLKALEFKPEQPYVLNYLGYSWVEKGLHLDRAQGMIRKAVKLRPNDGYIVDSLGWVLYQLEDFAGAVKQLERAVELRAEDPVINDHLGDAYWNVGRKQEARFQWRRALSFEPDKEFIEGIKKKIADGMPAKSTSAAN